MGGKYKMNSVYLKKINTGSQSQSNTSRERNNKESEKTKMSLLDELGKAILTLNLIIKL